MSFDPAIWSTARQRLPLPHLMTKIGDGKYAKKNADCPFCEGKKCFGVFDHQGRYRFKCHKPGCVANEPPGDISHNEVGYLALRKSLSVHDASIEYLKLAVPEILEEQQRKATEEKESKKPKPPEPEPRKVVPISEGQSPPPEPPKPPKESEPPPPPKPNPFHALWQKLVLNPRDRSKLRTERGFSDETLQKLGFRSNNHSNRVHLENLAREFPIEQLVSEGIYKDFKGGARPNPQLLGWGLSKRSRKDGENDEWDWTEPNIIPYLRENGEAFYLRPHKGALGRPTDEDEDEDVCSSHVYCPFLLSDLGPALEGLVVLCEGEYKAAALFQCGIPAIAIPGISFVRNRVFRHELIEILRRFHITDMVICFDNEVKDDPSFPERYKPDPIDRWDTPMWAEYIAIDLGREYFAPIKGSARIGILPDNLRDHGKADFDSALARCVRDEKDIAKGTAVARKIFQKVIEDARPHRQARDLFPSESRRIIEWKLRRLFYKALVASGGEEELKLASRFQAIGERELAVAYRSVVGCYYDRKTPDKEERKFLAEGAKIASQKVKQAEGAGINGSEIRQLKLRAKAAWELVKGMPVPISDFTLSCEFKLHTTDRKAIRLVKLRNHNDSGKNDGSLVRLTGAEMARGPEFMRWCYDTGRACWKGGQRKLADLCEDMDHHSFMRDIFEINHYGYHADSGLWFFGDCAFSQAGDRIEADANNVFWNAGIGYQVDSSIDERGSSFEQGAPLMLSPIGAKKKDIDPAMLFLQMCTDIYNTIGGYDALLSLGLVFAYAAAPELLKQHGGHSSIWFAGIMSEGKTTVARWLMRIWGFKELPGIRINKGTTHVGMSRTLAQYANLPVWFDEYRTHEIDADKEAVLRGSFDRNSASKGLMDNSNRTRSARIFTTPIVSGESSSGDAATRSRFANIIVTKKRRIGDGVARHAKIQAEAPHYYTIGRYLMEHRPDFAKAVLASLEQWMTGQDVIKRMPNERVRLVYGTGWAAFTTLWNMLSGTDADERLTLWNMISGTDRPSSEEDFRNFLFSHGEQALQDVISETFLTRFWTDIISALQRQKVKRHFFELRYVIVEDDGRLKAAQSGDANAIRVCYIAPHPVFDEYSQDLRARNESPPLDLGDLRRQMSKEQYFIPPPKSKDIRVHRASINGNKTSCWVINLEPDDKGNFPFPFAEDIIEILDVTKIDDEPPPREPEGRARDPQAVF